MFRSRSNQSLQTNSLSLSVSIHVSTTYVSMLRTSALTIAPGQRYDVVINANQTADNYWFRVSVGTDCGSNDMVGKDIPLGAILQYDGAPDGNPTSTGVTMRTSCNDETNLVPFVPNSVPTDIVPQAEMQLNHHQDATDNFLFRWTIDGSPIIVDWNQPSLQTALEGSSTFGNNSNVYEMPSSNWYFWWIQTTSFIAIPHPIHLHGHVSQLCDTNAVLRHPLIYRYIRTFTFWAPVRALGMARPPVSTSRIPRAEIRRRCRVVDTCFLRSLLIIRGCG